MAPRRNDLWERAFCTIYTSPFRYATLLPQNAEHQDLQAAMFEAWEGIAKNLRGSDQHPRERFACIDG